MENLVLTNTQLASTKKALVDGITIASGAKSTATYYHSRNDQIAAIKGAVSKLYNQSKELPLILANQKGSTGKFVHEALLNELQKTHQGGSCNIVNPIDWYDNGLSDKAILGALFNLNENGIPYVLRLFSDLKDSNVNNERTRKIVLGYIWGHSNIEFNVLKYRNKLAKALKHIYGVRKNSILISIAEKYLNSGVYGSQREHDIAQTLIGRYDLNNDLERAFKLFLFLNKRGTSDMYSVNDFPLLSEYYKATVDITSVSLVPEEVLIGLISDKNHPQYGQMWSGKLKKEATKKMLRKNVKVTSVNQQVRQTKSTKKLGVQKTVDLAKATDYMALYKTGFENGFTRELNKAIDELAKKDKIDMFPYGNIGIVLDNSNSMSGHKKESKNTPRAIAMFTSKVLGKSATNKNVVTTEGQTTDLASAFINLMKDEDVNNPYDAVFFLTDGYENMYEGLTNEVVSAFMVETERYLPVFQISPVTGAETGADVRSIGSDIVKMSVNSPKALMGQINARLLEVDTKTWLENQVKLLEDSTVSRYNKNKVEVLN
jgi:hypothetical protein